MKRREFIKNASRGAAALGIAGSTLAISGCTTKKDYDLLIKGGTIFDGTGNHGRVSDIAVVQGHIAKIEKDIPAVKAKKVIDASHLAVSPGFIDAHTHTDIHLLINPKAESKIRQGVTTEIGGNCGSSRYPVPEDSFEETRDSLKERFDLDMTWRDIDGFFARLDESKSAMNFATLIGNGTLRAAVMGPYDRPATEEELGKMRAIVDHAMKAGAFGISSGLEYAPSSFADTAELIDLCRVVAANKGVYATHMRSEDNLLLEAIDEAIEIRRKSGAKLQISHFKACYKPNWDKLDNAFARIEAAEKELGNVRADRYSYNAFSTGLSMFFPMWAKDGKTEDFINRLKDPANDAKLRNYVAQRESLLGTWDNVLISSVHTEKNKGIVGKTLLDVAREAGKNCYDYARDIIIEEENRVSMIGFAMSEDNLKRVLAHPLLVVGSDGNSLAPYGSLGEGNPHPRSYGTFPRVLGHFVREENIMPLETAIAKMTGRTAEAFGIRNRGFIKPGLAADIVVFNPDTVIDKATWSDPHQYPEGIDWVIVNGEVVVKEAEHTGARPGQILKLGTA